MVVPSYRVTTLDPSAVPVTAGAVSLVMRSPATPVSDALVSVRPVGAVAAVSTVTTRPEDAAPVLPAASIARALRVCAPTARPLVANSQLPCALTVADPSRDAPSYSATTLPSAAVPVTTGAATLVTASVVLRPLSVAAVSLTDPGAAGAVVSMVTSRLPEPSRVLPAASRARVEKLWAPSAWALEVMVQAPDRSAVAVPTTLPPTSRSMTLLASAVPVKVGVVTLVSRSELEAPLSDAAVSEGADGADGGVVSMVIVRAADRPLVLPAGSTACAVSVCAPSASAPSVASQAPLGLAVALPTSAPPL